ncbi:murein hydrolase activator EnvC family protein [Flocculibacter collagenilyticus]|uniref:murein hydrolase activator EnvC family protein n=1 Tax=Flocculibacter collagenilyticus TaxID=2744479 RepID=UPI0018F43C1F|nr:peptidoglycan DD-metalloendopeptidase family protein [Flocculibacter collagenilyticus]
MLKLIHRLHKSVLPSWSMLVMFSVCIACITTAPSVLAQTLDKTHQQQKLDEVKQQISERNKLIKKQRQDRASLSKRLKTAEQEIATVARALNGTNSNIAKYRNEVDALQQQKKQLITEQLQQEKLLAGQIASAYMSGSHDYSKMLLNQQEPSQFERMLSYYQYLNKARLAQISDLTHTITELETVTKTLANKLSELNLLKLEQQQQQQNLLAYQKDRKRTLKKLDATLNSEQQKLAQLIESEETIRKALEAMRNVTSEAIELAGLSKLKGQLHWPSKGQVKHKFGHRRKGRLRWKGTLLAGKTGTPVTTVHQGQVLFADWLNGFGWVIVIDHGDGYMSLYGHNQTLLKSVGEKVETGEPIALVGQSGGQTEPSLYFEIRHKGQALDPATWCRKG